MAPSQTKYHLNWSREAWSLTDALIEWRMLLCARVDFTEVGLMHLEDKHDRVVGDLLKAVLFQ